MKFFILSNKLGGGNIVLSHFINNDNEVFTNHVNDKEVVFFENSNILFKYYDKFRIFYYLFHVIYFYYKVLIANNKIRTNKFSVTHCFYLILIFLIPKSKKRNVFYYAQDLDFLFYNTFFSKYLLFCLRHFSRYGSVLSSNPILSEKLHDYGIPNKLSIKLYNSLIESVNYKPSELNNGDIKIYDYLILFRNGKHKSLNESIKLSEKLAALGKKVVVVNFTNNKFSLNANIKILCILPRDKFLTLLKSCRCFVCLSSWEGFGMPLVEASNFNLEIYSTKIPAYDYLKKIGYSNIFSIENLEIKSL